MLCHALDWGGVDSLGLEVPSEREMTVIVPSSPSGSPFPFRHGAKLGNHFVRRTFCENGKVQTKLLLSKALLPQRLPQKIPLKHTPTPHILGSATVEVATVLTVTWIGIIGLGENKKNKR